jgi:two-component system osmolarity sensor histidine kinase EnvZ
MKAASLSFSLARQNAWLLALVFVIFELLAAGAVIAFLMAPMARRAADDLAGLMLLSAQTRNELPPQTRPDFEIELARTHLLWLRDTAPGQVDDEWHGIYIGFLESALADKVGRMQHMTHSVAEGEDWFWAVLPSGQASLAVGFPSRRIGTHPVQTLMITLVAGLVLAVLAAIWMARRITRPLARLENAATKVGLGEIPELLAESGPRELATLARRFNQMARQVQELMASRTTMLAGVSHDLRTPLARIRLALALLADKPTPALIERIEKDVGEMDRLIGDVLNLARGLASEAIEDIDLAEMGRHLGSHEYRGRLDVNLPSGSLHVPARPLALRRVIGNLVDNALRYGDGKPVELRVERGEGEIRIGVLDRGPGIPAEQLDAVFQPFHRVEASRSPATGGTGLGLAIVRQLATANGWKIELGNRDGGGLAAWLSVPREIRAHSG